MCTSTSTPSSVCIPKAWPVCATMMIVPEHGATTPVGARRDREAVTYRLGGEHGIGHFW